MLCCSDSPKYVAAFVLVLQECTAVGGPDKHPMVFLKSPSNIGFMLSGASSRSEIVISYC